MRLRQEAVIAPRPGPGPVPVEYAVAVDRYLEQASLGPASRRVYRISLTSWAWALVGRAVPQGARRRGAVPPVVPRPRSARRSSPRRSPRPSLSCRSPSRCWPTIRRCACR